MTGERRSYVFLDEFARVDFDAIKYWCGEYYDNNFLKGKKMSNVFQVLAIQEFIEGSPLPKILVPITTVVAKDEQTATQNFTIDNAAELKDKENVQILCRPFC